MSCESELIARQKKTIEALQARINLMERIRITTDGSVRDLLTLGAEYQEQIRQLKGRLSKIAKEAAV